MTTAAHVVLLSLIHCFIQSFNFPSKNKEKKDLFNLLFLHHHLLLLPSSHRYHHHSSISHMCVAYYIQEEKCICEEITAEKRVHVD